MLARALAQKPRLLLLDEPFSGLDIPSRDELLEAIIYHTKESSLGVVWVTHDLEELALAANDVYIIFPSGLISPRPIANPVLLGAQGRGSENAATLARAVLNEIRRDHGNE